MTSQTTPALDLAPLRDRFSGALHTPADAGWEEARRAWNLAVDQRPAVVAEAASAADVAAAVRFARAAGLRVAPQGTGHGAAPLGDLSRTLLLKTHRMDAIAIDPAARTARVEAGALWGPVAELAGEHGLAALTGSSIDVGVVGYTLGGGIGFLAREHGLASERVTAIELVGADGAPRRVDGDSDGLDGELFWALRGGGGGFAVVTAVELALIDQPTVFAGSLFWPGETAREVLGAYRAWARAVPESVSSSARLLQLPDLPFVPEPLRGVPVVDVCFAFTGDPAEGEALLAPLRAAAPTVMERVGVVPAPMLGRIHGDPEQPVPGIGHHALIGELTPAAVDTLVEVAGHASGSPLIGVELRQLGGALARRPAGAGALGAVDGAFLLYGVGAPQSPEHAAAIVERLDRVVAAMAPWSTGGSCLNFADRPGAAARAFDAETLARLRAVKAAADPDGLLVANQPLG